MGIIPAVCFQNHDVGFGESFIRPVLSLYALVAVSGIIVRFFIGIEIVIAAEAPDRYRASNVNR